MKNTKKENYFSLRGMRGGLKETNATTNFNIQPLNLVYDPIFGRQKALLNYK